MRSRPELVFLGLLTVGRALADEGSGEGDRALASDRPSAAATFAHAAPHVDGRLDEPVWGAAKRYGGFVERQPTLRAKPPVATEFSVLFDAEAIYVGVYLHDDQPDRIRGVTKTRDDGALFSDDTISVKLDPALDRRTTVGFAINAAGARLDYRGINESEFRTEFDALWQGEVARTPGGWTAELRIPFQALGIDPQHPPAQLGLNLSRDHARRNATYDWALLAPPFSPIAASRYGSLTGLDELAELTRSSDLLTNWAIIPFAVTGYQRRRGAALDTEERSLLNGGLDVKAQLGTWRGHATLNTDFAQVDLDNQVVNLTRFGLFQPEKRDFFLGELEVLSFGRPSEAQMLYSRRIGLASDRAGAEPVPILEGVKVVGQPTPSLRFGMLQVTTRPEGEVPWTSHNVGRAIVELGGGSNVGVMVAGRQSLEDGDDRNTVVGLDTNVIGETVPFLIKSFVVGSITGPRSPAPAVGAGGDGRGREADRWAPGVGLDVTLRDLLFRPTLAYAYYDPELRADLGFLRRVGVHDATAAMTVEPRVDRDGISRVTTSLTGQLVGDSTLETLLDWRVTGDAFLVLDAGYVFGAYLTHRFEEVTAPFDVGRETTIVAGAYPMWVGSVSLDTPATHAVSASTFLTAREYYGGTLVEALGNVELAPTSLFRLSVGALYDRVWFDALPDFDSVVINSRLLLGFTPNLGLRLYTGYNLLGDVLQLQSRLRWIYAPGSDLFLVTEVDLDDDSWRANGVSMIAKATVRWPP